VDTDASKEGDAKTPSARTLRGLDWLNFFLADVRTGIGPFLAIYLAGYGWDEQRVGIALTVGGIAGLLTETPAGALVDHLRSKRALIAAGIVALAAGALLIAFVPTFWSVMSAQSWLAAHRAFSVRPSVPYRSGSWDTNCSIAARDVTRHSTRPATSWPPCRWACLATSFPIAAFFSS